MDRNGLTEVHVESAMPVASQADSRIVFESHAPMLANRLMEIASQRLSSNDAEIQDSGIDIVTKFRKNLFSEKPVVTAHIQAKMGEVSHDAKSRLLGAIRGKSEVVAEATVIRPGDSESSGG